MFHNNSLFNNYCLTAIKVVFTITDVVELNKILYCTYLPLNTIYYLDIMFNWRLEKFMIRFEWPIKLIIILSSSTYCFWVILHFCNKCFLHIFYGTRDQNTLYAMLYWRRCVLSCKYLIHLRKIKAFQRNGNNNTIIMYVYYLTLPHGKWD